MTRFFALLIVFVSSAVFGTDYPAPREGSWGVQSAPRRGR